MRRKLVIIAALVSLILGAVVWFKLSRSAEAFQLDADLVRLRHLKHYGTLIEEYRDTTGKYPFQGRSEAPLYVHVANDQQIAFTKNGPPNVHEVVSFADFVAELESGLGRTVEEYFDPQYRPVNKPNLYIYMVENDAYFFAVHLHQSFPFAKKVADNYYKAEISNAADDQNQAWMPQRLFDTPEFRAALQKPIVKPGFFAEREEKYIDFTKRE